MSLDNAATSYPSMAISQLMACFLIQTTKPTITTINFILIKKVFYKLLHVIPYSIQRNLLFKDKLLVKRKKAFYFPIFFRAGSLDILLIKSELKQKCHYSF